MTANDTQSKEMTSWAYEFLNSNGYIPNSNTPEIVQHTPWSQVSRFATSKGYIYLKHTPHKLALEANILTMLRNEFDAPVPVVIAFNQELDCFLMLDAGRPLREVLKKQFKAEVFCRAIDEFTSMQLKVANHIHRFKDIGVPDWRLDKLPRLFTDLLTHQELLLEDGLSETEIAELEMLAPMVTHLCDELSSFSIKQTIVQPDFNDNNSLIDDSNKITIIDLGEIVISHPFFSLLNVFLQMEKHHAVTKESIDHTKLTDACLKNFLAFESKEYLLQALNIARPLWFIYGALAGYRLIEACGKSKLMVHQHGKFVSSLRDFIAHANTT